MRENAQLVAVSVFVGDAKRRGTEGGIELLPILVIDLDYAAGTSVEHEIWGDTKVVLRGR